MEFKKFKKELQTHLAYMLVGQDRLFVVDINKDELWNIYLNSFPAGTNELYRERREYDCNCCKRFFRTFGNVVAIRDNKIISIWDFEINDPTFGPVVKALSEFIHSAKIVDGFITREHTFGTDTSLELSDDGSITWEHFYVELPRRFSCTAAGSDGDVMGKVRTSKEVLRSSLEEISRDAIEIVLDLIGQNSLYKGEEWNETLKQFLAIHKSYNNLDESLKDNFCWALSSKVEGALSRIKNCSIGMLLTDITGEMDLNMAVKRYEKAVAPSNYHHPKAIFTKGMVEKAQKLVAELGFEPSLFRRYATLEDITINNVLFVNRNVVKKMKGSIFDEMKEEATQNPRSFGKIEQIAIEKFIADVLPTATSLEVLVENFHSNNFVSLIAPKVKDSKTMFKWDNNFCWAYQGNITDSMKERVKALGGNVDGVLRFTNLWNENADNQDDLDAHCIEPDKNHIYFPNKRRMHLSSGMLDTDIMLPGKAVAVENIIYTSLKKMKNGLYNFYVENYNHRGGQSGFSAEIEFGGEIYSFEYSKPLRHKEIIKVATVEKTSEGFKIVKSLDPSTSSKEVWGMKTNQFHPVSVCMFSPNYWDGRGVGNKHYMFMLKDCKNDTRPNGFYNEFLKSELIPHRKVFEALGGRMKVEESDNQLSGLGFSSTKRNSLVCKVSGKVNRIVKVLF